MLDGDQRHYLTVQHLSGERSRLAGPVASCEVLRRCGRWWSGAGRRGGYGEFVRKGVCL